MSITDEGLIPVLEDGTDHDDVVVTLEPPTNREQEEDSLSSISDAPSVDHFNISVSKIKLLLRVYTLVMHDIKLEYSSDLKRHFVSMKVPELDQSSREESGMCTNMYYSVPTGATSMLVASS